LSEKEARLPAVAASGQEQLPCPQLGGPDEHGFRAFGTEEDLRRAFQAAHDLIYKHLARDPAASFDLLALVVTAKVLDEQAQVEERLFSPCLDLSPAEIESRLNALLAVAQEWLDSRADEVHVLPTVKLDASLAIALLKVFEGYSLTLTAETLAGADALGTAYEAMVGTTFRGELGAYFTPRNVSEFIAQMLDIRSGRVGDPACGTGGLLIAAHRYAKDARGSVECFGNDINPRMVHAARVNFLLHSLDRNAVAQGDGLDLTRMLKGWLGQDRDLTGAWWSAITDGPLDAVLANPPFAGFEQTAANLQHTETSWRSDGSFRTLNRTLPFLEAIVALLRIGGVAGIVLPTSILNAEEESFARFRELLLDHVEIRAIVGLPERAFVHTDCGVHGALLFFERVRRPRKTYKIFVDWAYNLGYDRLGRDVPHTDFPGILERYRSRKWSEANSVSITELRTWGRFDPAWIKVARSLPTVADQKSGAFVPLTDLVAVRDARISRRSFQPDQMYRFFEVADADLETGEIRAIRDAHGWELQRKSRIKNLVHAGDILLPNHRDSLIARSSPTGRSAVTVGAEADGVLTTDRFIVLRPLVDPQLAVAVLNSAGVRRQLVAQTRGAASLDVRDRTLAQVLVPKALVEGKAAQRIATEAEQIRGLRLELAARIESQRDLVEAAFGVQADFRPASRS
jgi:type I restriction-modification system DNA methylase subunit